MSPADHAALSSNVYLGVTVGLAHEHGHGMMTGLARLVQVFALYLRYFDLSRLTGAAQRVSMIVMKHGSECSPESWAIRSVMCRPLVDNKHLSAFAGFHHIGRVMLSETLEEAIGRSSMLGSEVTIGASQTCYMATVPYLG